jgi:hypothetical protein
MNVTESVHTVNVLPTARQSGAATPDSPCNRTGPFGVVITWLRKDWTG